MSDDILKNLKSRKKLESKLFPSPFTRFINNLNPMSSLGPKAGKDIREKGRTISLILIFTLAIAILSTINVFHIRELENKNLYISVMSISWFVFLNFAFLIFEATKLFNILLFTALITLTATAVTNMDQGTSQAKIGISIIALGTFPLLILSYYYLASSGNAVIQIKDAERERKDKEQKQLLLENYKREVKEAVKKELVEDVTSETAIKRRVADAYIEKLISDAKKGGSDKDKNKKKKEDKEKEKEKEDE